MTKNRYIDFLKGIAIMSVIYGHCLQYGSGSTFLQQELYWDNVLMKVIYSFHMPLFIAISGYLFCFSLEKHGAKECIIRRMKTLLPICISWAVILLARDIVIGTHLDVAHGIARFIRYVLTDFWFLWTVMICTSIVSILEGPVRRKCGGITILLYVAIFILFFVTPDILWFNAHKYMLPFFVVGYFYAKSGREWIDNHWMIGVISTVLWIVLLTFYSKNSYIYITGITILGKQSATSQIFIVLYRYAIGLAAIIAIIFYTKELHKNTRNVVYKKYLWIYSILEELGEDSLIYYVLSTYLFVYVVPIVTATFQLNYLIIFIETLAVFTLCFWVKTFLSKFKIVSSLIIGK